MADDRPKTGPDVQAAGLSKLFRRGVLCWLLVLSVSALAAPTPDRPIETLVADKEVRLFAVVYPQRFNSAQGGEARYHLVVWKGGTSPDALLETPADDLAFHDAVVALGAQPGNNLTMAAWNKRHDLDASEPKHTVEGAALAVRLSWADNPTGIPIEQAFLGPSPQHSALSTQHFLTPVLEWHFGGNRDRWFNRVPLASRPGCLLCLYSCPSGKVSNRALSVHDYVEAPTRFTADTKLLPPDGTAVTLTIRLVQ